MATKGMVRLMRGMTDRPERNLFLAAAGILLVMIAAGQLFAGHLAKEYKTSLLAHDAALMGYLSRSSVEEAELIRAISAEKTEADRLAGERLLAAAGATERTERTFLPDVERFYGASVRGALILHLVFSALYLAALCLFAGRRTRRLEQAAYKLRRFLDGDASARIEDCGEGALNRFFTLVNTMATSLHAHIEKEQRGREFLADTISDISHQLKTPLAALSMYNEILRDETSGNSVAESFTAKSRRELSRMEHLIANLLKLARLDAGAIEPERSRHNLHELLTDCLGGFQTRAEREGKKLTLRCGESLMLNLDETWFSEAVGNLIKNALDHTEEGGEIEVTCTETAASVELTVRDNGKGIHPEDLPHIFKRFYRSRYSKDRHGVGIGLSLARAIVERHGGVITAESEWGAGASFRLMFPRLTKL